MSRFAEELPVTHKRLIIMGEFIKLYNVPMKAMYLLKERITPTAGLELRIVPKRNTEHKLSLAEELYKEYCSLDDEFKKENGEYDERVKNIHL